MLKWCLLSFTENESCRFSPTGSEGHFELVDLSFSFSKVTIFYFRHTIAKHLMIATLRLPQLLLNSVNASVGLFSERPCMILRPLLFEQLKIKYMGTSL